MINALLGPMSFYFWHFVAPKTLGREETNENMIPALVLDSRAGGEILAAVTKQG